MAEGSALFESIRNDRLELILLPTEQCNLRCTYCYETFEHGKMGPAVIAGVKALIERRSPSLNELAISWFGGEPLLAMDVIGEISEHAIRTTAAAGIDFSADMTTNGYLLDRRRFAECLRHRVSFFQVSLDGDAELHDRTRVRRSGAGTFDRIWENLVDMKEVAADFAVLLRLHYTGQNYRQVARFAARLNDFIGDDPRFRVHFKSIGRLGGKNDHAITELSPQEEREVQQHLWSVSGCRQGADLMENYVCYAAKGNSLVIRSTGRIAKCTVALSDDFNSIGELTEQGELLVDQVKFQRWVAPVLEERWTDASCPLASVTREARPWQANGARQIRIHAIA